MGWVGLIQIVGVGRCSVEAHFVPVSGIQNTRAGGRRRRKRGCWDAGITLTSAHFHEDPRASQDEAPPLAAPTGDTTGWAPALSILIGTPTLPLM